MTVGLSLETTKRSTLFFLLEELATFMLVSIAPFKQQEQSLLALQQNVFQLCL